VLLLVPVFSYAPFAVAPGVDASVVVNGRVEPTVPRGAIALTTRHGRVRDGRRRVVPSGDATVIHRIHDGTDTGYATRGDANEDVDARRIRGDDITGELPVAIPLYGYVLWFARIPLGFVLLVVAPGIGLPRREYRQLRAVVEREAEADESVRSTQ